MKSCTTSIFLSPLAAPRPLWALPVLEKVHFSDALIYWKILRVERFYTMVKIFWGETPAKISPLEMVSVYNAFGNLIPQGEAGAPTLMKVSDALIGMDLLGKAETVIESQLDGGFVAADCGAFAYNWGLKL